MQLPYQDAETPAPGGGPGGGTWAGPGRGRRSFVISADADIF
jgi:hypothetical protein